MLSKGLVYLASNGKREQLHVQMSEFLMDTLMEGTEDMCPHTCVQDVMDTLMEGTEDMDRLTRRPSANRMIRLPSGQMMWST